MNKHLTIVASVFLLLLINPFYSIANKAAGGELIYEWISDSTYRFIYKYYNDCSGDTASATLPLCIKNPCNNSGFTVTMNRWVGPLPQGGPNGNPVQVGCSQYKTTCDSPASNLPGFKEYWYTAFVTLPSRCNSWRIFTHVSYRNANNNIQNATTRQLYTECRFNNTGSYQGNSSPYYSIKPSPYALQNTATVFNNGAIDPNGDSLVTEVIAPLTGVSTCADSAYNVVLNTMSPSLSIPNNPFQTNNTCTTNNSTGQIIFTPAQLGSNTLTLRTKEYRNGILIGTIMRDITITVLPYTVATPIVSGTCGSLTPGGGPINLSAIAGCVGQQLSFCFYIKSPDTNAILIVTDNHQFALPAATITYTNQKNDSVYGTFMMTPTLADAGSKNFTIIVKDSTCRPPGILLYTSTAVQIYIWPPVITVKDTSICAGSTVHLNVSGGANYQWAELPGGSSGSLSCTACIAPVATPSTTTSYVVVSTTTPFCNNNKDTITVNVLPYFSPVTASQDTFICAGDKFQLNAAGGGNSYAWTVLSGTLGSLSCNQCATPFANPVLTTRYLVRSNVSSCIGNADTVTISVLKRNKSIQTVQVHSDQNGFISHNTPTMFTAKVTECDSPTFVWKKNNVAISGATNSTNITTGLTNGDVITCCMDCMDACPFVNYTVCNSYTVNNIIFSSVNGISSENWISIYPNPNNGIFFVKGVTTDNNPLKLTILNQLGQKVFENEIAPINMQLNNQINLQLPNEVYILKINNFITNLSIYN